MTGKKLSYNKGELNLLRKDERVVPFLSIIVTFYNAEQYLRECIESVLKQDYQDFELILVDDGSKDQSLDICREYEKNDSRVCVITQKNQGCTAARKTGMRMVKGHYVSFIDSDDWLDASMYEKMCRKAKEYSADIVICDFNTAYKNGMIRITQEIDEGFYNKEKLCEEIYPELLCDCKASNKFYKILPAVWNKIFKKEIIEDYLFQANDQIKLGEDIVRVYPSLMKAENMYYLKHEYLYFYRQREGSMTREYDIKYLRNLNALVLDLEKFWVKDQGMKCQLAGYTCHMVEEAIENIVSLGSRRDVKERFIQSYRGTEVEKLVRQYNTNLLSRFQKLKFYLLRRNRFNVLFFVCRVKYLVKRQRGNAKNEIVYQCYE